MATSLRCNVWNQYAENGVESLSRGVRVVVQGRLVQRLSETKEDERRTVTELRVDEVGPSLTYAIAKVNQVLWFLTKSLGVSPGDDAGGEAEERLVDVVAAFQRMRRRFMP